MGRQRRRSVSGGSHKDMVLSSSTASASAVGCFPESLTLESSSTPRGGVGAAKALLETVLQLQNTATGRYFLHDFCFESDTKQRQQQRQQQDQEHYHYYNAEENSLLSLAAGLLTRAQQVDYYSCNTNFNTNNYNNSSSRHHSNCSSSKSSSSFLRRFLLQRDAESGYTPLHSAVHRGNIAYILLYLQTALSSSSLHNVYCSNSYDYQQLQLPRITQRPMLMLHQVGPLAAPTAAAPNTAATASINKGTKGNNSSNSSSHHLSLLQAMVTAVDDEGFTAADLLAAQQRKYLLQCRLSLPRAKIIPFTAPITQNTNNSGRRRSSFDLAENTDSNNEDENIQNEFDLLSRHLPVLPHQVADDEVNNNNNDDNNNDDNNNSSATRSIPTPTNTTTTFGCEVITFGLDHHCALGVGATTTTTTNSSTSSSVVTTKSSSTTNTTATSITTTTSTASVTSAPIKLIRPQRVQALAPRPGQKQGAVAVAAAAHHTLVVMGGRDGGGADGGGHLYAFGLGRGGRLGTGHETPCPTPTRILGALQGRVVVGVAAAENHSLCVTQCGNVYAWGSNRFGQVGIATNGDSGGGSNSSGPGINDGGNHSRRLVPRRVDDLKQVHCVAVAAGEKHSVALSNQGHVYVWGDNTAGQLGICRRTGIHKVQRVEALWKNNKACIAIAASEQATLVLAIPDSGRRGNLAFSVNSIYSWGHGSHVPSRVHFERGPAKAKAEFSTKPARSINPIAIACARYHNVAITSDGEVYTWGLHAEPLGTKSKNKSQQTTSSTHHHHPNNNNASLIVASPQLVKGMLPENGGGIAVAVSACENHTAVLTDTGSLYTWGSTHGKNILGHEGVNWQPDPRKVPGVHRAVGVAVAKEHTVLLVGTVFPPIPEATKVKATAASLSPQPTTSHPSLSLEDLAAHKVAGYVDLFNVLSVLITAERTNCPFLVDYCMEFCRFNLDGVLNVGEKSVLNTYLKEQLMSSLLPRPLAENRDAHLHPLLNSVITTSTPRCQDNDKNMPVILLEQSSRLSTFQEWLQGCESLVQEPHVANMIVHNRHVADKKSASNRAPRVRFHSQALPKRDSASATTSGGPRTILRTSEELLKEMSLLKNMDLSTMTMANVEAKQQYLTKELRGIRKRISQIAKLQAETSGSVLSTEQREKLARRPQLETYLQALEPALASVDKKLLEFVKKENLQIPTPELTVPEKDFTLEKDVEKNNKEEPSSVPGSSRSLRCDVCGITCPDQKSHTLHLNGRKHRNRVALVQEEEQRKAATLMMEEQQRQLLVGPITPAEEIPVKNVVDHNPWGVTSGKSHKSNTPSANYRLPPPPHQTPDSLVTKATQTPQIRPKPAAKPSLLDIMAEEESRNSTVRKPSPRTPPIVSVVSKLSNMYSPAKIPSFNLSLPAGSAPPLKSPPWAKKPVAVASASTNSLFLGDFVVVEQPKPATCDRRRSSSGASWGSPKAASSSNVPGGTPVVGAATVAAKSLVDIQQQEQEFQDKEDQTFASNGKWFIERRERAHSFRDIENDANKEREDRLFVEEQFRIESMIRAENEKAKPKEEQDTKKNRRPNSVGGKSDGNNRNRNNKSRSNNKDNSQRPQRKKKAAPSKDMATAQAKAVSITTTDT